MLNRVEHEAGPKVAVTVEPSFDFLSDEYRDFWRPDRATAFQAPLWMAKMHAHLLPALNALQRTITIRDASTGALRVVMPMVMQNASGVKILQPADFGVCDYNSVVGDRLVLAGLARDAKVTKAITAATSGADIVMFRKVRTDDFDPSLLLGRMKSSAGENSAYLCETGTDFDEFRLKILRRKFTKELGRLQRQTERDFGSYEHRRVTDAHELRTIFEFLRRTQGERQATSLLGRQPFFEFYLDLAISGAASGAALTYASYVGGEPAAALFGPAEDDELHAVLIGTDTARYDRISAGTQIIYRIIEMRMAQGHAQFDMGLGDPGYKTHFRPTILPMLNHSKALTPTGAAVGLIYHRSKGLKNILRNFVPDVR